MRRSRLLKIARGAILAATATALCLAAAQDAQAHVRRVRGVVFQPAYRTVFVRPAPVVLLRPAPVRVGYVPARHVHCRWRSGYYYAPGFGYHRHTTDLRGIYFGMHVRF